MSETFEFSGDNISIETAVAQAMGAASLCWDPRPTGEFVPEEALAISAALLAFLKTTDSVHVYADEAGAYRWRRVAAGNFEKVASSGEAFSSKDAAVTAAQRANPGMAVVVLP